MKPMIQDTFHAIHKDDNAPQKGPSFSTFAESSANDEANNGAIDETPPAPVLVAVATPESPAPRC